MYKVTHRIVVIKIISVCYCPLITEINKLCDQKRALRNHHTDRGCCKCVHPPDTMYVFLLQIRDLCLGTQFPTIKSVSVKDAVLHPQYQHIETLELCLDLEYSGGFQLSIDANMVLGKAAYLSVKGLFVIYVKINVIFIGGDFHIHFWVMTPYCYESF